MSHRLTRIAAILLLVICLGLTANATATSLKLWQAPRIYIDKNHVITAVQFRYIDGQHGPETVAEASRLKIYKNKHGAWEFKNSRNKTFMPYGSWIVTYHNGQTASGSDKWFKDRFTKVFSVGCK